MKKLALTLLVIGTLLNTACKKDPADAPSIPPVSSLEMNFKDFNNSNKTTDTSQTGWYWGRSVTHVAFWNIALTIHLAIPVASFKEAFNHTPKYVSKKKGWLWQYTMNHSSGTYTAKLYGKQEKDEVSWRMLISKAGAYEDVEWYTGTSKADNSYGSWSLNKNAANPTPYLTADWSVSGEVKKIKYTSIEANSAEKGSYIEYTVNPSLTFDRQYDIFSVSKNYAIDIEWQKSTKMGRIKEPGFYGDDNWRCWNSSLANDTCQ